MSARRQRIYRRRRIVVGILAVLMLSLVAFSVYSIARLAGAVSNALTREDSVSMSRAEVPSPTQSSRTKTCTSDDVTMHLQAADATVPVGGSLAFTVTITHEGSGSCLIDDSVVSTVLTISSGKDTVWKSNSCPVDSHLMLLAKGDKDITTITWNANRSGSQCVRDSDLPKVDRGTYVARVALRDDPDLMSDQVAVLVQ